MVHTAILVSLAMAFGSTLPSPPDPNLPVQRHGTLDREIVRYHIQLRGPAVRHCYVQELGRNPSWRTSQISVTVQLSIDATGRVTACEPGETPIEQCVARAICTIRFPYVFDTLVNGQTQVSSRTTDVRYRFRFQRPQPRRPGSRPTSTESDSANPAASAPTQLQEPTPASAPASTPASSTSLPAPGTSQPPPPPVRTHTLPRIRVHSGDDPLDGLDRANPL